MNLRVAAWGVIALALFAAGCGRTAPTAQDAVSVTGTAARGFPKPVPIVWRHSYFNFDAGSTIDYRITRLGGGIFYARATVGRPEIFFDRLATPVVWSEIPGLPRDSVVTGLRQYWSVSPEGALWFHGASNRGAESHTEPPLRVLLADPTAGEAWADTVVFESFLDGVPFFRNDEAYAWTLSERAMLRLPGGNFHAYRSTSVITDAPPTGDNARYRLASKPTIPEIQRGMWFARNRGVVARDWPSGTGPEVTNTSTFEAIDFGKGPIPPPPPVPGEQ